MKDIEIKVRQILGNVKDRDKVRKIMNLIKKTHQETREKHIIPTLEELNKNHLDGWKTAHSGVVEID